MKGLRDWKNKGHEMSGEQGSGSRIHGVMANYLASQERDSGTNSHQHQKDS